MSDLFAEMAVDLHKYRSSPERTLERIVDWTRFAADCAGAGIMIRHARNRIETPVSTSPAIAKAHDLQVDLNEGPCLDVITEQLGRTFITGNAGADPRYPKWGPAVVELGFFSVISVALKTDERVYGSLNLYAEEPYAFTDDDVAVTEVFSRHASVALAGAEEGHGLQAAVDARKLIGQAQGILMERFDIDADRAFDFLRRQSQDNNIKLRAVADWIVHNRHDPSLIQGTPLEPSPEPRPAQPIIVGD